MIKMTWIRKNIPQTFKLFSIYLLHKRAECHSICATLCHMCREGNLISLEILNMFFSPSLMLLAHSAYSLNQGMQKIRGTFLNFLANQLNSLSVMLFSILCNNVASDNKAAHSEGQDLCVTICFLGLFLHVWHFVEYKMLLWYKCDKWA